MQDVVETDTSVFVLCRQELAIKNQYVRYLVNFIAHKQEPSSALHLYD